MTIQERMYSILESKPGKSQAELAAVLGVGTAQTTSWKKRQADPPAKYIAQIAEYLEVSIPYLLTGVDKNPQPLSRDEKEFLAMFNGLNASQKRLIKAGMRDFLAANSEQETAVG